MNNPFEDVSLHQGNNNNNNNVENINNGVSHDIIFNQKRTKICRHKKGAKDTRDLGTNNLRIERWHNTTSNITHHQIVACQEGTTKIVIRGPIKPDYCNADTNIQLLQKNNGYFVVRMPIINVAWNDTALSNSTTSSMHNSNNSTTIGQVRIYDITFKHEVDAKTFINVMKNLIKVEDNDAAAVTSSTITKKRPKPEVDNASNDDYNNDVNNNENCATIDYGETQNIFEINVRRPFNKRRYY